MESPGRAHKTMVSDLLDRGATRGRFYELAIGAVIGKRTTKRRMCRCGGCRFCDSRDALSGAKIIPDAYTIDKVARTITIHEVEVTSAISSEKYRRLYEWMWWLDGHEWALKLITIGRNGESVEVNLFERWCESDEAMGRKRHRLHNPPRRAAGGQQPRR